MTQQTFKYFFAISIKLLHIKIPASTIPCLSIVIPNKTDSNFMKER